LHRDEIPPGTLYLLILRTLTRSGEMHGYEIADSIQRISDDVLQVEEGSLYPALQRMLIRLGDREMGHDSRKPPRSVLPTNRGETQTIRRGNVAV
jgi:Transcriptional regulator PadR-like family